MSDTRISYTIYPEDRVASVNLRDGVVGIVQNYADKSDPLNQTRCFVVRLGKSLAFRIVISDVDPRASGERQAMAQALSAMLLIGAEHASEIRDAMTALRVPE